VGFFLGGFMKGKYKGPRRPDPLKAVLEELESTLARYKAGRDGDAAKDAFISGVYAGYEDGMRRAIDIVNYEIGIRQNSPNISYGMEKGPPNPGNPKG
jgi:hypothetical protein